MFDGPLVGSGVYYYEQHGAGTDQAPVYREVTSSCCYFKRSGTGATPSSMAASDVAGGHKDQAIIAIFRDANDRAIKGIESFLRGTVLQSGKRT